MKTMVMSINTLGEGMEEALLASEKAGNSSGLSKKECLRLRLLSEELFGMMRTITGEVEADYWLEYKLKSFSIHLKANVKLTQEMYDELVDVSTKGKNAAVRGLMGSIKNMIEVMLLPHPPEPSMMSLGVMNLGSSGNYYSDAYKWSMKQYIDGLKNDGNQTEDTEYARDDLERSIVAQLSDEVTVSIVGTCVEITIFKAF